MGQMMGKVLKGKGDMGKMMEKFQKEKAIWER